MKTEIINVTKSYGKKRVLTGVNITAESGSCVGIIGKNGSGKSTLFSVLSGIARKEEGDFLYGGESLFSSKKKRRELLGFVPQTPPLMEELSAKDNLSLWYTKDALELSLDEGVLRMLGVGDFLKTEVRKMSGGMKKRLSICCAVAHDPRLLILDEPSASLDIEGKEKIAEYLTLFKEKGGTVLLATHDSLEFEICDKTYLLKDGKAEEFSYDRSSFKEMFR
ncbi:MAG: ABC transporter ATP-binding protein [Clostridia bacterium]|nr:ABC transporter ATP-binding protein [Clostridia bacterium]MBQ7897823.1 ABC transporter ATP-binding protein [Clostridia bacterium]